MPVTLTGIRGIVFDLDDTLYPESEYVFSGFRAVGTWLKARMNCPIDPAGRLIELFGSGRRGHLFDDLLAEWECSRPHDLIPQMVACYREHLPDIHLHPDAERAIERWRGRFRLGLITDGPLDAQRRKIEALSLDGPLNPVLCTDQWGREFWKPHTRAFEEVERAWRISGRQLVYVADNPSKDFVGPCRRGWIPLQIARAGGEYEGVEGTAEGKPEWKITTLDELDLTS